MKFNINTCKVLNLEMTTSDHFIFSLDGNALKNVHEERDLGVFITDDLKLSRHCQEALKRP